MLAIKKHPLSLKAATLGTVAFIIGLTGAAAYIDRFNQHENLVFSQEETVSNTSDTMPTGQDPSTSASQNAGSSQSTASPQVAGSTSTSGTAGSSAPTPSTVGTTPTTTTFEPGRGGGSTGTTSTTSPTGSGGTTTDPLSPVTDSCLLQNCTTTTLQETTDDLLSP